MLLAHTHSGKSHTFKKKKIFATHTEPPRTHTHTAAVTYPAANKPNLDHSRNTMASLQTHLAPVGEVMGVAPWYPASLLPLFYRSGSRAGLGLARMLRSTQLRISQLKWLISIFKAFQRHQVRITSYWKMFFFSWTKRREVRRSELDNKMKKSFSCLFEWKMKAKIYFAFYFTF